MSARRVVLHDGPTRPRPTPHSLRGPALPQAGGATKTFPPPGWTLEGLGWHARQHRRTKEFAVRHLARANTDVLLDMRGRELEVEQQHAQLDARELELRQHGAEVAQQVAAVQEATKAILALPWVAQAVTAPMARVADDERDTP